MLYIYTVFLFLISIFTKYNELVIDLLTFILIFFWYSVYFYLIYERYTLMLFLSKTNIFLIMFIGLCMWIWLIIYNGLPFLWFLISYAYMKIYKTKTLEEATELTIQKEPIAFYIRWLFRIFIIGVKIGQENYKPKISFFMTPGSILFYLFWGYSIKVFIMLYFK